jgi:hypothetical protein
MLLFFLFLILIELTKSAPELWFPKNGLIEENYNNLVDVWSLGLVSLQLWVGLTTTELVTKYLTFIGMPFNFMS